MPGAKKGKPSNSLPCAVYSKGPEGSKSMKIRLKVVPESRRPQISKKSCRFCTFCRLGAPYGAQMRSLARLEWVLGAALGASKMLRIKKGISSRGPLVAPWVSAAL